MKGPFRKGCIAAGAVLGLAVVPSAGVADPPPGGTLPPAALAHSHAGATHSGMAQSPGTSDPSSTAGTSGASCPTYSLSQPFLAWGDPRQYTLLGGETVGNVGGQGWQLSKGAQFTTTTLADGSQGQVLDMPAGSVVVTPPMCVNDSSYPRARAMVSDVSGAQGIAVSVSYPGTGVRAKSLAAGRIKNPHSGWRPSAPIMLHAGSLRGVHQVQLRLVARGGEYRLYNLYVDPRRIR